MIKEEKVLEEKILRERFCDDCGKQVFWELACAKAQCEICEKDLCEHCIGYEESNGDYRKVYCKRCWAIGDPYRQKIAELEIQIDNLYDEWSGECVS